MRGVLGRGEPGENPVITDGPGSSRLVLTERQAAALSRLAGHAAACPRAVTRELLRVLPSVLLFVHQRAGAEHAVLCGAALDAGMMVVAILRGKTMEEAKPDGGRIQQANDRAVLGVRIRECVYAAVRVMGSHEQSLPSDLLAPDPRDYARLVRKIDHIIDELLELERELTRR